jgi:hypothetical protein
MRNMFSVIVAQNKQDMSLYGRNGIERVRKGEGGRPE